MSSALWKNIKGTPGYMVSNKGEVKSLDRVVICKNGVKKHLKGIILKSTKTTAEYCLVKLTSGNDPYPVHRYVAEAFIPNPKKKATVNHINGVKDDNRVENLEWMTYSENIRHSFEKLGRKKPQAMLGRTGKDCPNSKPIFQLDLDGNKIRRFDSCKQGADSVGFVKSAISACANGRTKTSGGFRWEYERKENK